VQPGDSWRVESCSLQQRQPNSCVPKHAGRIWDCLYLQGCRTTENRLKIDDGFGQNEVLLPSVFSEVVLSEPSRNFSLDQQRVWFFTCEEGEKCNRAIPGALYIACNHSNLRPRYRQEYPRGESCTCEWKFGN